MKKRNIVMILTDQMHKNAIGKIDKNILTPNIDALADDGILFSNAYSNNPVCGPYRGCLFTGKYTCENTVYENNFPLPANTKTIADVFNESGYDTSFVGKWHLGGTGNRIIPPELRGGFNHFLGYQCHNGFWVDNYFYNENNEAIVFDGHRTDITTDLGIKRLELLAEGEKPFLHVIFYQAPHYPEQPADEYYELYKDAEILYPPNYEDIDPYTPTYSPRSPRPYKYCADYQKYGGNMKEYKKRYNAMCTQIDAGVGRIINRLEELGIYDDTLLVFSSDHGDMQGSHGLLNKCYPYEESCGIPLILKAENIQKGSFINTPVSCIDCFTTILNYAGIKDTQSLEGRDLLDLAENEDKYKDDYIVAENYIKANYWTMIRDGRYKLVVDTFTKDSIMLFDMHEDIYEMNNLVSRIDYSETKEKLHSMFIEWFNKRKLKPTKYYDKPM